MAETRRAMTREAYGRALLEAGKEDERIVVLTADLAGSTHTKYFADAFPNRFFNMGVAEPNMMGVAAGLAMSGKRPFASTFAIFAAGKPWEQIRQVIAYPRVPVRIVATHAGLTVGEDGASHQMLEDIGIMRILPNMNVIVPADANETTAVVKFIARFDAGPVYVRLSRAPSPVVFDEPPPFEFPAATVLSPGNDISIFACGNMVSVALEACRRLAEEKISAEVINVSSIKPLDAETVITSVTKTNAALTVEEHQIIGGLGSAICELLAAELPTRVMRIGVQDRFGQSGKAEQLLSYYGLSEQQIVVGAKEVLK
ncbi:transketolase family protein [Candidatus Acetothermia bacterium]|jgi:transketolase|nr:transketolase family protein [Candidatus Acetothermia bacterium]MCI2427063.1 transketolase family protein [Candidatus Acetothermia bacterium]MCI2428168.1 transketolase family protein [Candidatus Acetothermia bacterium]